MLTWCDLKVGQRHDLEDEVVCITTICAPTLVNRKSLSVQPCNTEEVLALFLE